MGGCALYRSVPERRGLGRLESKIRWPAKVATVAMANKTARIIWAVLTKEHEFRPIAAPVAVLPAL
jgi:transposase